MAVPAAAAAAAAAAPAKRVPALNVTFCMEHDHVPLHALRVFMRDEGAYKASHVAYVEQLDATAATMSLAVPGTLARRGLRHLMASDLANITAANAQTLQLDPSVCLWVTQKAAPSLPNTVFAAQTPRLALVGKGTLGTTEGQAALRKVKAELSGRIKGLLTQASLPIESNAVLAEVDAKMYSAKPKVGAPGELDSVEVSPQRVLDPPLVEAVAFGVPVTVITAKGERIRGVLCAVTEAPKDASGKTSVGDKKALLDRPITLSIKAFNDATAADLAATRAVAAIRLYAAAERDAATRLAIPLTADPPASKLFLSSRPAKRRAESDKPATVPAAAAAAGAGAGADAKASRPAAAAAAGAAAAAAAVSALPDMPASAESGVPPPAKRVRVASISPRLTANTAVPPASPQLTALNAMVDDGRRDALAKLSASQSQLERLRKTLVANLTLILAEPPATGFTPPVMQTFGEVELDRLMERLSRTVTGERHAMNSPANREAVIGESVQRMDKEHALAGAAQDVAKCAAALATELARVRQDVQDWQKTTKSIAEAQARESTRVANDIMLKASEVLVKVQAAVTSMTKPQSPARKPASPERASRGVARMTALALHHAPLPDADRILARVSATSTDEHTTVASAAAST